MADPAPQSAASQTPQAPESIAEAALNAAQQAVTSLGQEAGTTAGGAQPFSPEPLSKADSSTTPAKGIDLLSDVNLNVKIELGRTRMLVEDVLKLNEGAVVELDKLAGDPVDVYVNDRHIARGEVLVLNDNFCVRINEIINQVGEPEGRSV